MKAKFVLKTFIFSDAQHETRNGNTNNSCPLDNSKVKSTVLRKKVIQARAVASMRQSEALASVI